MRIGEYAHSGSWDLKKVLTGVDVAGLLNGKPVRALTHADEIMVWFKASKTDALGVGAVRNHFATGESLCVVQAMAWLWSHFPERFDQREERLPWFRWPGGSPLRREQLQDVLGRPAVGLGLPPERFRSHSLRIGGATALFHATKDIEIVKRYGRWTSGAFQRYLWDANQDASGLAKQMATDGTSLMPVGHPKPPTHPELRHHPERGHRVQWAEPLET